MRPRVESFDISQVCFSPAVRQRSMQRSIQFDFRSSIMSSPFLIGGCASLIKSNHDARHWKMNPRGLNFLPERVKHFAVSSDLSRELLSLRRTILTAYWSALVIDDYHASVRKAKQKIDRAIPVATG
jgi:hypothetical protein